MAKYLKPVRKINRKKLIHAKMADVKADRFEGVEGPLDTQHLLISTLLPPAVKAFLKECEDEVDRICGKRYKRDETGNYRWGSQKGSIILANQQVAIEKPRVRKKNGQEVALETYDKFQDPGHFDESVFAEGLKRVSQRDYQKGLKKISSSFGFKKSSISRRWIKATAEKLSDLQDRSLKTMGIRAVFIDGKKFSKYGVIIALGVASTGQKFILGIYQANNEDHVSCLNLINDLERRGLPECGLLFIVDGGSGLNKALNMKYDCHDIKKRRAIRVRCHVHKWRNFEASLGDGAEQISGLFWSLRDAKNMTEAKSISDRIEAILKQQNLSALNSFLEAKDDLLAIHDLKLNQRLRRFFSTTNPIESLNSLIEEDMRRVKKWRDSEHFQRWLATYCLANEKRMRRISGYQDLPALWIRLRTLVAEEKNVDSNEAVA